MNASFIAPRSWRSWIAGCLIVVGAAASEKAPDLTGLYDDEGTIITSTAGREADTVSLHAMLALEFTPALARILHERTERVRIRQGPGSLEIEVIERDDKVGWQRAWTLGEGYAVQDGRIVIHLRPGKFGQDEFLLILRNVTDHRLLELEVQRLTPTILGPSIHPIGTFLFPRLPDEPVEEGKT